MREPASAPFRENWGKGSDPDMMVIVNDPDIPFDRRSAERDTSEIPMPFDLLIHSEGEWNSLKRDGRFCRTQDHEAVWV